MTELIYRYTFEHSVPVPELEDTLMLTVIAAESLHGESQARLDLGHTFDGDQRQCVIDASTPAGRDFNRLFVGFVSREFGRSSFRVERVVARPETTTV